MKLYLAFVAAAVLQISPALAEVIVVSEGDTLSSIATDVLGEEGRWLEICSVNNLSDCDVLAPGMTLALPGAEEPTDAPPAAMQEQAAPMTEVEVQAATAADAPSPPAELPSTPQTVPAAGTDLLAVPTSWRAYQATVVPSNGLLQISGEDVEGQAYLSGLAVEAQQAYRVTATISKAVGSARVHLRVLEPELVILGQSSSAADGVEVLSVEFSPSEDTVGIVILTGASGPVDVTGVIIEELP